MLLHFHMAWCAGAKLRLQTGILSITIFIYSNLHLYILCPIPSHHHCCWYLAILSCMLSLSVQFVKSKPGLTFSPPTCMDGRNGWRTLCAHRECSVERASFSNNLKFRANNWHHTDHRLQHAAAEEDKHRRHGPTYVQLHSTNPILTVGVTGQEPQLCGNTWEWGGWSFSKAAVGLWGCLVVAPLGLGI